MKRYALRKQGLQLEGIDQYLFDPNPDALITIEELQVKLTQFPLNLPTQDALTFARYMIEESDETLFYLKMDDSSAVVRVRAILRNIVGSYDLITNTTHLLKQLHIPVKKFKDQIIEFILTNPSTKDDTDSNKAYCQAEVYCLFGYLKVFFDSFTYADISLIPKQIDFINQKNFDLVGNINQFQFYTLIQMYL